jgi:cyclohexa-1,5-dienecarbonyl-CoA hydratase
LDDQIPQLPALKLVVFEGVGKHFSFGASVEEHLPETVGDMLPAFHDLFRKLESTSIPTAAVVRGQCLGGGMELAAWCGRLVCTPTAAFGVPEVKLAVFPPIAALLLPWRCGGQRGSEVVYSGRTVKAAEAVEIGLADQCAEDPTAALEEWFEKNLAGNSALAIRYAWQASRMEIAEALQNRLPKLEALYLKDLMSHEDPVEGIRSFIERRPAQWRHR